MKTLHYKRHGQGEPVIVLHGLFGMLDNWQSFTKALEDKFDFILVDQRNHGRSFHAPEMDYSSMAEDVVQLMDALGIEKAHVLGHSMGGKTAMQLAMEHSHRVSRLVVVDIGPQAYPAGHDKIFEALRSLPIEEVESRKEAREHLSHYISEDSIQLFLLKNLKRNSSGGYEWRMNLESIYENYESILSAIAIADPVEVPTLFVRGSRSPYLRDRDMETLRHNFLQVQFKTLEAGHWVHAERPEDLQTVVTEFYEEDIK